MPNGTTGAELETPFVCKHGQNEEEYSLSFDNLFANCYWGHYYLYQYSHGYVVSLNFESYVLEWVGYKRVYFNLSLIFEAFKTRQGSVASSITQLSMCMIFIKHRTTRVTTESRSLFSFNTYALRTIHLISANLTAEKDKTIKTITKVQLHVKSSTCFLRFAKETFSNLA